MVAYVNIKNQVQDQINARSKANSNSPIRDIFATGANALLNDLGPKSDPDANIKEPITALFNLVTDGSVEKAKDRQRAKRNKQAVKVAQEKYEATAPLRKQETKDKIFERLQLKDAERTHTNTRLTENIIPRIKVPDNLKSSFRKQLIENDVVLNTFKTIAESGKDIEINFIEKGKDYIQGIKVSDTIVGDDGKKYIAYNRTDHVSNFKRYSATMRSNIVNYLDNKFTDTDSREYQAIQNLKTTGTLTSDERQLLLPHMRDAVITRAGTNPELKRSVNAIIAGHTVMNENIDTQIFKRLDDSLQNTIRNNSNEVNKINSQINALRRSIADAKAVPIAKRKRGLEGEISRQEEVIADLQKQKENFEFNIQRAEVNVAERTVVKGLLKNRIIARAVADKNLDQLNQPDVVRQYVAEVLRDASFQEEASSLVKQLQQSGLVSRPQQKSDKGTKTISEQDKDKEEEEEEEELKGGRKLEITPLATTPSPSG